LHALKKEEPMDKERIKKILAGLGIAGLMAGGVLTTPDRAFSAWVGGSSGAGSTKEKEGVKQEQGGSGVSMTGTSEEKEQAEKEKKKEATPETEKQIGTSSWSGSKK
jgi:radical SAM modification target selenobiotic family peptide